MIAAEAAKVGSDIYKSKKMGEYQDDLIAEEERYQEEQQAQKRKDALARAIGASKMADLWSGYGPTKNFIKPPNMDMANLIGGIGNVGSQAAVNFGNG